MKHNLKKLGLITFILVLVVSLMGCSLVKQSSNNNAAKSTAEKQKEAAKHEEETKITIDTDKTTQLKKEKTISDGKVYVQNKRVIATMIIKDGIKDEEVKDLAQKYGKDLKKKYNNMPVSVMAVRGDKNIVNLTIK